MEKGAAYFAELEKQYTTAARAVQRDIDTWFSRFATNNEITLQEARKLLSGNELEEFRWNVMEYVEKGRTLNYTNQWAKQLENASAKFHISRLEALKLQMQHHVEVLYGGEHDDLAKLLEKIYTDGYYHTAYEVQKGFNIGYSLMKLDTNKVEKVLSKPWAADGSNFSDRIWKQKSQLVSELHNNLTQAIIRGQNPSVVKDVIAKRFNVSKGQAGRLVMTEAAFFHSASTKDCYKDLGVERYEVLATLDKRTSDVCRALDGKVFRMSEYEVGVTAPPFHTWCRTTTVPYFDDEFELDAERAARDGDGKTYYVPASMKYPEWYKKYVANPSPSVRIKLEDIPKLSNQEAVMYKNELEEELETLSPDDSLRDVINAKIDKIYNKLGFSNITAGTGKNNYFRMITGNHSYVDDLKATNPNYSTNKREWTLNCQRCVSAYEARRRGFNVEAKARILKGTDNLPVMLNQDGWPAVYKDGHKALVNISSNSTTRVRQKVIDHVLQWDDGARGIVRVRWQSGGGHVFIAEKENGLVRFIDPQSNETDVSYYFDYAKIHETYIMRIDNLEFTDLILDCCK